jgi:hypothetical protein
LGEAMSRKIILNGVPVTVVDDDQANECEFVICMRYGEFKDNLFGFCFGVWLRDHVPANLAKPPAESLCRMRDQETGRDKGEKRNAEALARELVRVARLRERTFGGGLAAILDVSIENAIQALGMGEDVLILAVLSNLQCF